ncbi:MAG: membrane protein insertion efficiency factor YidD [Thermoanaerobaculales bacterium]|nr:membrane protein insertion efficiency factor YidD [Thermoanaerobaculales bacterium]
MRRWVSVFVIIGLTALFLSTDLSRSPNEQLTGRIMVKGIHVYRSVFSEAFSRMGIECRFKPTCSRYAEISIQNLGVVAGTAVSIRRLLRCGPWTPAGTYDPPAAKADKKLPSNRDRLDPVASEAVPPYAPPAEGASRVQQ